MRNSDFCERLRLNRWLVFVLLFSMAAVLFSLLVEYLGDSPCALCLWQRGLYLGIFFVAFFGILSERKGLALLLVGLLFLINLMLSGYQVAIQMHLVKDFCKVPSIGSIEDFHHLLNAKPPCSKIGWSFFGIPLSGFNAFSSFVVLLFMFRVWRNSSDRLLYSIPAIRNFYAKLFRI